MAESKSGGPVAAVKESVAGNPAVDRLKEEAVSFAAAQAQRLLVATGKRLGEATTRLTDVAEGRSDSLIGPVIKDTLKGAVKDTAKGAVGKLTGKRKGGGGKGKFVTISEDVDVGVPLREAYNQWTQFQEFSTFAKGVQGVESADDTDSNWRAKIFWSTRSWKAHTTEQIPDERIAWTSEGAKGTLKGVVTFHELAESLTRVLLVIEYYPKGLFEKTGNIWRAQGRRARLDLKNFRRFVMMRGEATGEWRGEIRDGEVVVGHDEAVEREEQDREERDTEGADKPAEDAYEEESGDDRDSGGSEDEEPEDAYEDEDAEAEGEEDADAAYEDEEEEEGAEGEPEDEPEDSYDEEEDDAEDTYEEEPADEEEDEREPEPAR
ncbi:MULTISPECIES: SRPBCC family protein [Streptomyces]|uniref:Polyketide cyclase / dehydrase and lipid transport n=1 Tax=Streptomyces rimosus subsp. rimosus TaxID=132474 RepID=A0ABY3Z9U3_STRRM|nr:MULTISPECIES: SRPBCC family protein [Streptomyces]KOG68563.1 cyclase [Kitasatospora aureofaciens]KEF04086.1 cyclase [Streptomyces rimosus]KUJ31748.1 cyclase [Streptomyces rimosus subsp. rimosus]UNZ06883.1 Polyketide cyclase / dehydrase and lipid transport [Streptomyces rimosus subsp. rimosus]UTH98337.1 Polyketide cyclase / dehydrase and lipid transport [Streptomyces rimosus subsp. rimosus]